MVGSAYAAEAETVALWAGGEGGGGAAAAIRRAQREQAEVGPALRAQRAAVLGQGLLVGRSLLVAVHAAAQQLLVLRRGVVLTVRSGGIR